MSLLVHNLIAYSSIKVEWGEPVQSKLPFGAPVVVIMQGGDRAAGGRDRKFK